MIEDYRVDIRLNEIYEQWLTQWKAIEHPKNITRMEKLKEYTKWRRFLDFWSNNTRGLSMSEALLAYDRSKKLSS